MWLSSRGLLLRESMKNVVGHGGKGRNPFPFSSLTLSSSYSSCCRGFLGLRAIANFEIVVDMVRKAVPIAFTLVYNFQTFTLYVIDDRKFIKKIVKEGEGYERPNEGAIVKFPALIWILHLPMKLTVKLQDSTMFLKKMYNEGEELFEFKTYEAVLTIKKGEVALLSIAPEYAFGLSKSRQELAVVLANSTVYYDVELVSFEKKKESWDLNTEQKIVAAGRKKKEGNVLFMVDKYVRALKRYDKAVKFIEYDTSSSEEEKKQAKALKVACNLNNAACKLKLEDYKQAEKLCTKVLLEAHSKNVKALYRRAKAYIQLANLDLAEDVKLEYKKMKEKLKEYNKKEAKFYGKINYWFNNLCVEINDTLMVDLLGLQKVAAKEAEPRNVGTKA
ncbi:hypothetical protein UlMin_001147 [Ulmus minor]